MWFRVDMLLTFICLARSENIRSSQLCEWNSCHVECDNVVYNGHSTYFKTFLIFFCIRITHLFARSIVYAANTDGYLIKPLPLAMYCIWNYYITAMHCETAWMNQTLDHMRDFLHFNVLTSRASERTQQKIHNEQKNILKPEFIRRIMSLKYTAVYHINCSFNGRDNGILFLSCWWCQTNNQLQCCYDSIWNVTHWLHGFFTFFLSVFIIFAWDFPNENSHRKRGFSSKFGNIFRQFSLIFLDFEAVYFLL